ncbi:MAG: PAS domain S-box protein, partial [Proteobacteria bacterium]|nr:PAS domain S-box protein [Pseudomonadota bacterium]
VNQRMCEMLGYSQQELMEMDPWSTMSAQSRPKTEERRERAARGLNLTPLVEVCAVHKDGHDVWAIINSKTIHHPNGSVTVLSVAQDITEAKQRAQELNKIEKLEALGVLAGGMAHDFNNLLCAILGNASLGRAHAEDHSRLQPILDEIESASLRAQSLTQQLLTFSAGGKPIKKVTNLAKTLVDCAPFAVRGSQSTCVFNLSEDLANVEIDEGQIGQVVTNLVINAMQASNEGNKIVIGAENIEITEISPSPLNPGSYVRFSVADEGTGISPENLPRVFDPYFSTKKGGTGLGLATCHSIVQQHGGHISVESNSKLGTTFHVLLPASSREPPEDNRAVPKQPRGQGR